MNAIRTASALATATLGLLVVCCASPQGAASSLQPVVPGTEAAPGIPSQQAIADAEVVERLSAARCDRSQSCQRVGPGAAYRDRDDCMSHMGAMVANELNTSRCPGGIGEVALSRCEKSVRLGECDMPGAEYTTSAHCKLDQMCLQ